MALIALNSEAQKKMYRCYTWSGPYHDHSEKSFSIRDIVKNYKLVTIDDFYFGHSVSSQIGSDSGTHNVIMTLQVTSYDPSTGVAKIINSGGTGNCGISSAAVYVYAY